MKRQLLLLCSVLVLGSAGSPAMAQQKGNYVMVIHGGAGTLSAATIDEAAARGYHAALHDIVKAAQAMLLQGASALDAACQAVEMLEDCPLFNAGHGAVFTHAETHELDAAVMNGADLAAGAVAGLAHGRNPVPAA